MHIFCRSQQAPLAEPCLQARGTTDAKVHDARLSQVALERSLGRLWETTRRNWLPNPPASASATLIHRANVIDSLVGVVDDMALPAKNTMSTSDQELWRVIIENLTAQDDHSELATTDSRKHRLATQTLDQPFTQQPRGVRIH